MLVYCSFKNRYETHMCFKGIGLRAQNMTTILGSMFTKTEGDLYDHLMNT